MPFYIKNSKGTYTLVDDDNFMYGREARNNDPSTTKSYYKCVRGKYGCKARVHTKFNEPEIIKFVNSHNHPSSVAEVNARLAQEQMKNQALSSEYSTHEVVSNAVASLDGDSLAKLPTPQTLARKIRRYRQRAEKESMDVNASLPLTFDLPPEVELQSQEEAVHMNYEFDIDVNPEIEEDNFCKEEDEDDKSKVWNSLEPSSSHQKASTMVIPEMDHDSGASPPSKKAKAAADFSIVIKRSHSITENSLMDIMGEKSYSETDINDSIHGHIRLPAVAVAIIDTPQFQRLRFLKQVGTCHLVYPNATHNRFQHSLGVGHLAFQFGQKLKNDYPDYLNEKDIICVMLAGLCHDLGHGPYSHLWEAFVRIARPDIDWHHEDSSIMMLDYLIEDNNLKPVLKNLADIDDQDILFIKEAIAGPIDPQTGLPARQVVPSSKSWPYRGRSIEKSFLYEIVANKTSGIDVDKWDYLKRDQFYLNIGTVASYDRFLHCIKVLEVDGRRRICVRDKAYELILDMYMDRARLHKHGYQHRVTKIVDQMLVDAWLLADKHMRVKGSDGKLYSLSEACQNVVAYEKLTDEIFNRIKDTDDEHPDMVKASQIMKRIMARDFYRCYGKGICTSPGHPYRGRDRKEVEEEVKQFLLEQDPTLPVEDIFVDKSCNSGGRNPFQRVTFYDKENKLVEADSLNICKSLPEHLHFDTFYIITKSADPEQRQRLRPFIMQFMEKNNVN